MAADIFFESSNQKTDRFFGACARMTACGWRLKLAADRAGII
jgi:hypothetical protein